MAGPPTLVVLPISPWSERARWALDHHRVSYRTVRHAPVFGELKLRRLVGTRARPATVPVLIDGDAVFADSWDIAQYADRIGRAHKLIPADRTQQVRAWVDLAELISTRARVLLVPELLQNARALDESAPPGIPIAIRSALRPVMRVGARWFARKYAVEPGDRASCERVMREGFERLRAGLQGGSRYLLGSFSYADIAMATSLQGIAPVADDYVPLGPATRELWTRPQFARDYADLVQWRDELYRAHRVRSVPSHANAAAAEA